MQIKLNAYNHIVIYISFKSFFFVNLSAECVPTVRGPYRRTVYCKNK